MKKIKLNKKAIILISVVGVIILAVILVLVFGLSKKKDTTKKTQTKKEKVVEKVKKVNIVDLDNNLRPYAVMINNHHEARPQAGLDKAYIVYEFMVEGGITRMMALFT